MSEFTPLPDPIVASMGIYAASVYGRVWRYCQMERGRCFAPAHRIATELNLGQRTVERYLSRLVEDGWIERDSGKSDGKPSTYYTTGKWVMGGSATAADPS
ncbi:MAG: helix-turn-helix domain-containing protein, partial [Chloroflexi bacterium]|nr:helix-turn-helix domain-containing protein [Chloroflexota bacterium]